MLFGSWVSACKEIVEENHGEIDKYLGDGFLAYWHDDEKSVENVAASLIKLKQMQKIEPRFRLVLHYGLVSRGGLRSMGEESLIGKEVIFVFRMEKLGGSLGGHLMASASAQTKLGPAVPSQPAGSHQLKGFDWQLRVLQVLFGDGLPSGRRGSFNAAARGLRAGCPRNLLRAVKDQAVRIVDPSQLVAAQFVNRRFRHRRTKAFDDGIGDRFRRPIRELARTPLDGNACSLLGAVDRVVGPAALQLVDRGIERFVRRRSIRGVQRFGGLAVLDDERKRPVDRLLIVRVSLRLRGQPGPVEHLLRLALDVGLLPGLLLAARLRLRRTLGMLRCLVDEGADYAIDLGRLGHRGHNQERQAGSTL